MVIGLFSYSLCFRLLCCNVLKCPDRLFIYLFNMKVVLEYTQKERERKKEKKTISRQCLNHKMYLITT